MLNASYPEDPKVLSMVHEMDDPIITARIVRTFTITHRKKYSVTFICNIYKKRLSQCIDVLQTI